MSVEQEGATVEQSELHPVEVFAEPWEGGVEADDITVKDVADGLAGHAPDALVRVAVPLGEVHRCLDVEQVAQAVAAGSDETVVELVTERWDSLYQTIRPN